MPEEGLKHTLMNSCQGSFQSEVPGHCQLCRHGGDTPWDYPWRKTVEDMNLGPRACRAPGSAPPLTLTAVLPQSVVLVFSGASRSASRAFPCELGAASECHSCNSRGGLARAGEGP